MKSVLITGFPGFLGSALLPKVLARRPDQNAVCLVQERWREVAEQHLQDLAETDPQLQDRVHLVNGDITETGLGIPADIAADIDEVFHLAAVYDLTVPEEVARRVNVDGTRHVIEFCRGRDDFRRLQYVSTCYVSGSYEGTFYEDDLDVGQELQNFYESTKFEAEELIREAIAFGLPASIYRPGVVVGDSQTGETQKFDGPYFLAHLLKLQPKVAVIPRVADPDEIVFSMVTRDFVVDGIDVLSTADVAVGKTYALTDPNAPTVGRLVDTFARLLNRHFTWVPLPLPMLKPVVQIPGVESMIGVPAESLDYFAFPTKYDTSNATADLAELGISCPSFDDYAPNLIRFFLDHPEISSSAMT